MKKAVDRTLGIILAIAVVMSIVFAYNYSGSFTKYCSYSITVSGGMSAVSGQAVTQASKPSSSSAGITYVSVSAYCSSGARSYNSNSGYSGDIKTRATAPGSGTPTYAVCASSCYNSSGKAVNLCNCTVKSA